jgi:hypothetical protein
MVGILKGIHAEDSTENNTKGFSVLIAFSGAVWRGYLNLHFWSLHLTLYIYWVVICALPWFFVEKRRPGLQLPPGTTLLTIGLKQVSTAFRECMRLKQTFLYLIFYFLM